MKKDEIPSYSLFNLKKDLLNTLKNGNKQQKDLYKIYSAKKKLKKGEDRRITSYSFMFELLDNNVNLLRPYELDQRSLKDNYVNIADETIYKHIDKRYRPKKKSIDTRKKIAEAIRKGKNQGLSFQYMFNIFNAYIESKKIVLDEFHFYSGTDDLEERYKINRFLNKNRRLFPKEFQDTIYIPFWGFMLAYFQVDFYYLFNHNAYEMIQTVDELKEHIIRANEKLSSQIDEKMLYGLDYDYLSEFRVGNIEVQDEYSDRMPSDIDICRLKKADYGKLNIRCKDEFQLELFYWALLNNYRMDPDIVPIVIDSDEIKYLPAELNSIHEMLEFLYNVKIKNESVFFELSRANKVIFILKNKYTRNFNCEKEYTRLLESSMKLATPSIKSLFLTTRVIHTQYDYFIANRYKIPFGYVELCCRGYDSHNKISDPFLNKILSEELNDFMYASLCKSKSKKNNRIEMIDAILMWRLRISGTVSGMIPEDRKLVLANISFYSDSLCLERNDEAIVTLVQQAIDAEKIHFKGNVINYSVKKNELITKLDGFGGLINREFDPKDISFDMKSLFDFGGLFHLETVNITHYYVWTNETYLYYLQAYYIYIKAFQNPIYPELTTEENLILLCNQIRFVETYILLKDMLVENKQDRKYILMIDWLIEGKEKYEKELNR